MSNYVTFKDMIEFQRWLNDSMDERWWTDRSKRCESADGAGTTTTSTSQKTTGDTEPAADSGPSVGTTESTTGSATDSGAGSVAAAVESLREALASDRQRLADHLSANRLLGLREAVDAVLALDVPGKLAAANDELHRRAVRIFKAEADANTWQANCDEMVHNALKAHKECDSLRSRLSEAVGLLRKTYGHWTDYAVIPSDVMRDVDAFLAREKETDGVSIDKPTQPPDHVHNLTRELSIALEIAIAYCVQHGIDKGGECACDLCERVENLKTHTTRALSDHEKQKAEKCQTQSGASAGTRSGTISPQPQEHASHGSEKDSMGTAANAPDSVPAPPPPPAPAGTGATDAKAGGTERSDGRVSTSAERARSSVTPSAPVRGEPAVVTAARERWEREPDSECCDNCGEVTPYIHREHYDALAEALRVEREACDRMRENLWPIVHLSGATGAACCDTANAFKWMKAHDARRAGEGRS